MRNTIFFLLGAAIIVSLALRPSNTSASNQSAAGQQPMNQSVTPRQAVSLSNYDIRKEADAIRASGVDRMGTAIAATDRAASRRAIESLKADLSSGPGDNLQVTMNEAGVPKAIFNTEGPLSFPQAGTPDSIARGFLASHADLFGPTAEMRIMNEDHDQETTFINYEQTINGIPVFQGQIQVALSQSGQILSVMEGMLIPKGEIDTTPALSESEGLQRAILQAGQQAPSLFTMTRDRAAIGERAIYQNPLGEGRDEILSDLMVMRIGQRAVLAWHSYVDVGPNEWYELLVDADTGKLLYRHNLYADAAQGTVFTTNPNIPRSRLSFVGDTTINTAAGWMSRSTITSGNNVDAYLDTDGNNQPDEITSDSEGILNGHAFSIRQEFHFPFSAAVDPSTQRGVDVTSLFYFCNVIHDFVYRLGFTESAGNFQYNNFRRGGAGLDSVRAEAQDGAGFNNANFATPPDGSRPRMQMFLYNQTAIRRSASEDGDVVVHEYGHGVSNRLVGGPSNIGCLQGTQSEAMGEGWSDYLSVTFFLDGVHAEFTSNNAVRGSRRAAYTLPSNAIHDSYEDLGNQGFEPHNDGEVWAATLVDLDATLGRALARRLVVDGMKRTPCNPSFLNARDGILNADRALNGGANVCAIWEVFARHGMGIAALGNDGTTHVASYNTPSTCP
ncbi:MAG TPA: M36 family metallopeptidase [Blastocatellia bacterium]|nr:M36 family metallopeptidase [Blastocatellia bacterium]